MITLLKSPLFYVLGFIYVIAYLAYGMKGLFWIVMVTIIPAVIILSVVLFFAAAKVKKLVDLNEKYPEKFKELLKNT